MDNNSTNKKVRKKEYIYFNMLVKFGHFWIDGGKIISRFKTFGGGGGVKHQVDITLERREKKF